MTYVLNNGAPRSAQPRAVAAQRARAVPQRRAVRTGPVDGQAPDGQRGGALRLREPECAGAGERAGTLAPGPDVAASGGRRRLAGPVAAPRRRVRFVRQRQGPPSRRPSTGTPSGTTRRSPRRTTPCSSTRPPPGRGPTRTGISCRRNRAGRAVEPQLRAPRCRRRRWTTS